MAYSTLDIDISSGNATEQAEEAAKAKRLKTLSAAADYLGIKAWMLPYRTTAEIAEAIKAIFNHPVTDEQVRAALSDLD